MLGLFRDVIQIDVVIYVSPHIGTGPVLELGLIFRPVLELGRGRPQIVTMPV